MEYNDILSAIINQFDFAYMLIINVLTYMLIKVVDYFNKEKNVTTVEKRLLLVFSIIFISVVYIIDGYDNYKILVNSAILSPVFYSWVLRPILKKFKLGYKEYDKTLE